MGITSDESGGVPSAVVSGKIMVRQAVAAMLDGSGLEIQELTGELVITNPLSPERGQVHVEYGDGYVSWERPSWTYWGNLQGYEDKEGGPGIGAAQILSALTDPPR